jgi:uncharacterized protein (TIGR00255 family)
MLKSMTGFGKASGEVGLKTVSVDIRSLNSKQFDINLRLPAQFREKEADIRLDVIKALERGKIDVHVSINQDTNVMAGKINTELAKQYYYSLKKLAEDLGEKPDDYFSLLMKMPDIFSQGDERIDDAEWTSLRDLIAKALSNADQFRIDEGEALKNDLAKRVQFIDTQLENLLKYEGERIASIRTRLKQKLNEWVGSDKIDENRLEQELVFYIEKLDISEERTRLKQHCSYFISTMNEPENTGKKLAFISQEMGREINTIGSKANHVEIQRVVVLMKDELEKIKEQLNNVL